MTTDPDPRNLIAEAFRIEGITEGECRSIFLDWALGAPDDPAPHIRALLDRHGGLAPEHPMTRVLSAGLDRAGAPRRRGGRKGRLQA